MIFSAVAVTSFFALLQGTNADTSSVPVAVVTDASNSVTPHQQHYSDELIAAMVKTVKEHQASVTNVKTTTPRLRAAPQTPFGVRPSTVKQILGKDKPGPEDPEDGDGKSKPKPDPKPKPTPSNYMIFSYHVDDSTCDDSSLIESHGYIIDKCYTGVGDLAGLFWKFSVTNDETNYFLDYGFYVDSECATVPVVSATEPVPYGCAARGNSGGFDRYKNFVTSTKLPKFKDGVLFNGYQTEEDCHHHKKDDVVDWSFLSNNQCDPDIFSPVYGEHVTDETRSCQKKKGRGNDDEIMFTLFDTNDMTCSGEVTTTTNIDSGWDCKYGSNSGAGAVYQEPKCV